MEWMVSVVTISFLKLKYWSVVQLITGHLLHSAQCSLMLEATDHSAHLSKDNLPAWARVVVPQGGLSALD